LITIFIAGKVIDGVLLGSNNRKAVFVISDKYPEIREFIMKKLNRGGTYISGEGIYRHNHKKIIYTVISRRELAALQEFVKEADPEAFMSVFETNQIYGRGFIPIEES
ncbi:MAG TPA: YitT family protein, partial [bacterium]|nr:YitT family protein [bacterium]